MKTPISAQIPNWEDISNKYHDAMGIEKTSAINYGYVGRTFENELPNISIKSQYGQSDYDYYRQNEALPTNPRDVVGICMRVCKQEGLVRNVIDLMGEFASKGIEVVHPNKKAEKFGKEWFKYVRGRNVSERFLNLLYRAGQVPIGITYGKINVKTQKKWSSTYGDISPENPTVIKKRIPLAYIFYNPQNIDCINPDMAALTGEPIYGLTLNGGLKSSLNRANNAGVNTQSMIDKIPSDLRDALYNNKKILPLTKDNFSIYFYKKDDWETFATPMLYSIIPDVITLKKMKLADKSALDGAISNVRLWTVGKLTDNPQTCMIPNKGMLNTLRSILANNVGGGTFDLVAGPDVDFKESATQVHHFLGISKYEPVYKSIYEGLGIPSNVSGGGSDSGGFNSAFIQMQTFVERLEYGRGILIEFWTQELRKVQLAMGYARPFEIMFDQITLGDDASIKTILISLVDRDIISVDTLLSKFNLFSQVEQERIKREHKARQADNHPNKASPYHDPQTQDEMKKILLNQGGVSPSEVGIDLNQKKPGERTNLEHQAELEKIKIQSKPKPANPNGRPKTKKDSIKRKRRAVKPNTGKGFIENLMWANASQEKISEILTPVYLLDCKKSDVRSLSKEQFEELEQFKFSVLSSLQPLTSINEDVISSQITDGFKSNGDIMQLAKDLVYNISKDSNKKLTTKELREIQSCAFATYYEEDDESEENDENNTL